MELVWTDYMKYRAALRGFDLIKIEDIVRYSPERYFDTQTERWVVIGHHDKQLVIIAYEIEQDTVTPITIHPTTRQQIRFRIRIRRYTLE